MIDSMQLAIIKKDLRTIMFNKRLFPVLLIIPFVFSVILPTMFVLIILFVPEGASDFQQLLELLSITDQGGDSSITLITLILNNILPIFFILTPIMVSSVMAASSFVGEKEKRTLETLLYSPISLKKIFQSKILAALSLSMIVSFLSFLVLVLTVQLELMLFTNHHITLNLITWFIILFLLSPSLSLLSITLIVSGSAKAETVEESQQRAAFLVLPIILLLVGQFTGIILINASLLIGLAIIFLLLALLMMRRSEKKFNYEELLKQ